MRVLFAVLISALMFASAAYAHEYKVASIDIHHPAVNATPPSAKVAAGYLTLKNSGSSDDTLVSVDAPTIANKVEIHEMKMTDGIMKMRPLADGLDVPAGQEVALSPHGAHVMFMGLKQPLVAGEKYEATLHFKNAGAVAVTFNVEPIGTEASSVHAHH